MSFVVPADLVLLASATMTTLEEGYAIVTQRSALQKRCVGGVNSLLQQFRRFYQE